MVHPIVLAARRAYKFLRSDPESPFNEADRDGDGKLDRDEVERILPFVAEILPDKEALSRDVAAFMAAADKDGDGYITFSELMNFFCSHLSSIISGKAISGSASAILEAALEMIRLCDWDDDGKLNIDEVAKVLQFGAEVVDLVADQMSELGPLSQVLGGKLAEKTARLLAKTLLATFDFDKDGMLTPSELLFGCATLTMFLSHMEESEKDMANYGDFDEEFKLDEDDAEGAPHQAAPRHPPPHHHPSPPSPFTRAPHP